VNLIKTWKKCKKEKPRNKRRRYNSSLFQGKHTGVSTLWDDDEDYKHKKLG